MPPISVWVPLFLSQRTSHRPKCVFVNVAITFGFVPFAVLCQPTSASIYGMTGFLLLLAKNVRLAVGESHVRGHTGQLEVDVIFVHLDICVVDIRRILAL